MHELFELFWKHRARDAEPRVVVGSYGHQFAPEEIFAALGLDSISLMIGGNEAWQTRGMDYLTPTSCVYSRQMIGFFEEMVANQADVPKIKAMIHTNFCSGDYHSMEIIRHYFGIETIPLMIPYKITANAFKMVVNGLKSAIDRLATLAGTAYDPERLQAVIEQSCRISDQFGQFAKVPVAGSQRLADFYEIALAPWDKKASLITSLIETRGSGSTRLTPGALNIVLTGSPVLVGDRFTTMLDGVDMPVRFYDFYFGDQRALKKIPKEPGDLRGLKQDVDFSNPIHVLAAYYLETLAPERMVYGARDHLDARVKQILRYADFLPDGQQIDGVIGHVLKFCDVYGTDRSQFKARLQDANHVPVLDIERDYSASSVGQISTRVEAFKEMLVNEKKHADKFE
nr:2-hydroxyacyl-CoA dehydratase family protein [Candidatus Sigynarchaeota archaeon]